MRLAPGELGALLDDGLEFLLVLDLLEQGDGALEALLESLLVLVELLEGVGQGLRVGILGGLLQLG